MFEIEINKTSRHGLFETWLEAVGYGMEHLDPYGLEWDWVMV